MPCTSPGWAAPPHWRSAPTARPVSCPTPGPSVMRRAIRSRRSWPRSARASADHRTVGLTPTRSNGIFGRGRTWWAGGRALDRSSTDGVVEMRTTLRAAIEGRVLEPDDADYDAARSVWNAMVDRRPRHIVQCAGIADVVAAVRFAAAEGLDVGIRCGGHGIVGHAVPDGGLMIDL